MTKILLAVLIGALSLAPSRADTCDDLDFSSAFKCINTKGCAWCPANAACRESDLLVLVQMSGCPNVEDWQVSHNFFSDPLYDAQKWVYDAINVLPVWEQGLTGEGITVQVVDSGLNKDHPEFAGKVDLEASCDEFAPRRRGNGKLSTHGSAVASIAVGNANNGECAAGIAPDSKLAVCLNQDAVAAFEKGIATTDVSVNSWNIDACEQLKPKKRQLRVLQEEDCPLGLPDRRTGLQPRLGSKECNDVLHETCYYEFEKNEKICQKHFHLFNKCSYNDLSKAELGVLERGITEGRNGKGIIYVFAAGNEYDSGETINMEGWLNTRYTITVGAVDQVGVHSSYSTTGASALFISGPGGDHDFSTQHVAATPGAEGCRNSGVGTSFATPAVAGGIALVLQANPNLTWRDVQTILLSTAKKTDPDSFSWSTNAAGYNHSPKYGFGLMDTGAAVEKAKTWVNLEEEMSVSAESGNVDVAIGPDSNSPGSAKIRLDASPAFVTESVVVNLELDHASRGDLKVVLESPKGTVSELLPGYRHESLRMEGNQTLELLTIRNWGENPSGDWTITLIDTAHGNLAGKPCDDLDFSTYYEDWDMDLSCEDLAFQEFCEGGKVQYPVQHDNETGYAADQACCACGGGLIVSIEGTLVSWKLVAYGHMVPTEAPTQSPTREPSRPPTQAPTQAPSEATSEPTQHTWDHFELVQKNGAFSVEEGI